MFLVSSKMVGTTHAPVLSPSLPSLACGSLLFAQLGRAKELLVPGLLLASLELFTLRCVIRHRQMRGHLASGSNFLAGLVYTGKLHVQPQLLVPFPGMFLGPSQGETLEKLNTGGWKRPFVKQTETLKDAISPNLFLNQFLHQRGEGTFQQISELRVLVAR